MPAVRQYGASPIGEPVLLSDVAQILIDLSSGGLRSGTTTEALRHRRWGADGVDPTAGDKRGTGHGQAEAASPSSAQSRGCRRAAPESGGRRGGGHYGVGGRPGQGEGGEPRWAP